MENIELLAPAGNENALIAAVQSGADAVYLGGSRFNARQSAENFTAEQMKKWISYCHLYGVKVYVAVNTLIKEKEITELLEYIKELNEAGADAVIVQDMGAVELFRKVIPDMPVHASTQMTVSSTSGVKYLEQKGIERVVLARELSKEEITEICRTTDVEIEIFVHGALCMCYSGQCLMSSIIGGRSGNRGRCAQPCRLPYTLTENGKNIKNGFLLSPKDMCLIDEIRGIKQKLSLKIEGRLKRGEYVSAVVGIYRKYIDNKQEVLAEDKKELLNAFNRGGFTKAFFGHEKDMMCHNNSSNAADNVFTDEAKKRARKDANFRKIPVYMFASVSEGECFSLTMWDDEANSVTVSSEVKAERAKSNPVQTGRIIEQLSKLGATPFEASDITVENDGLCAISVGVINDVRRRAAELLTEQRTSHELRRVNDVVLHEKAEKSSELKISVEVESLEQAKTALQLGIKRIYAPVSVARRMKGVIPKTPDINKMRADMQEFNEVYVNSLADIYDNRGKKLYASQRLNVYNSYSAENLGVDSITVSPELNLKEIAQVCENTSIQTEIIAYGRLTLMIMANCPVKACGKCAKSGAEYRLRDRMGEEFPVLCGDNCTARLINSKPLYMADKWESLKKTGADFARLVFTIESSAECEEIIKEYINAKNGIKAYAWKENTFTRGHYFRGVE